MIDVLNRHLFFVVLRLGVLDNLKFYTKRIWGLVFIDKIKELINIFEKCSYYEIGPALLAFEEFICRGLEASDEDLMNLQELFCFYDENYSDQYPNLMNEKLSNCDVLISDLFGNFEKDGYTIELQTGSVTDTTTSIEVMVSNSAGITENEFQCFYDNKDLGVSPDNYFGLIFRAFKETRKQLDNKNIEEIIKTYDI